MKILLAYDNSSYAQVALERAAMIATMTKAELTIITVIQDLCYPSTEVLTEQCDAMTLAFKKEAEQGLAKAAEPLSAKGITCNTIIKVGHPADLILDTAKDIGADLIVVGSRGMRGIERFLLGSVSNTVAKHATCDVLIVR